MISGATGATVLVRTTEADRLAGLLLKVDGQVQQLGPDRLQISGIDSAAIGIIAARAGIALIELTPQLATLEEAFMEITRDAVEYHGERSRRRLNRRRQLRDHDDRHGTGAGRDGTEPGHPGRGDPL